MAYLKEKYIDYTFKIDWTSSIPYNPENDTVEVKLTTMDNQDYIANFITIKFIKSMFEKNRRTGECQSGTYFCMPGMVIVNKIEHGIIKSIINDLIDNYEVEDYFKKVD